MSIRVKVAESAKELEDVLRLRHEVYAGEEGYFKDTPQDAHGVIVDQFDVFPLVANIVAYSGEEPIGTIRLNLDLGQGLPPEELYDYSDFRQKVTEEWRSKYDKEPSIGSAGMLAIKKSWRHRRDVIRALLKVGAGVGCAWEATHLVTSVNAKTASMYKRMNFETLDDQQWVEEIGEYIVPMASSLEAFYKWAFRDYVTNNTITRLFSNRFQRLVIGAGEIIFPQGEKGKEAYIIDKGTVRISSRIGDTGEDLTLATLGRGKLFGEMSLIDSHPRSAQATAVTNTELIALNRDDFIEGLQKHPDKIQDVLSIFSERIRRADELAVALVHDSDILRMEYALKDIRNSAVPDLNCPGALIAKVSLSDFIRNAGVTRQEAENFLNAQQKNQTIEYTEHYVRFLNAKAGAPLP